MSKIGQGLIAALQEAVDDAEGRISLRTTHPHIRPVRKTISADEIRDTRKNLGMTQGGFALTIGVSRKTVESWETGRYMPDGAARRLITMLQADPQIPEKYGIYTK